MTASKQEIRLATLRVVRNGYVIDFWVGPGYPQDVTHKFVFETFENLAKWLEQNLAEPNA